MNLKAVPLPKPEELTQFSGIMANKDVPVLVSAIKGRAHFFVTGYKDHFEKIKTPPGVLRFSLRKSLEGDPISVTFMAT
jgi:hypothetical protein